MQSRNVTAVLTHAFEAGSGFPGSLRTSSNVLPGCQAELEFFFRYIEGDLQESVADWCYDSRPVANPEMEHRPDPDVSVYRSFFCEIVSSTQPAQRKVLAIRLQR